MSNSIFVENVDDKNLDLASLNIVQNDSNLIINEEEDKEIKVAYIDKILNNIYYGSLTWAEYQLTRGTKVSDKIGITENLTEEVEKAFNYFY